MKFKKIIFKSLFVIFIGLVVGIICLNVSYFNIKEINVSGNKKLNSEYVKKISGIKLEENIFKINPRNVERLMKVQNQYVKKVDIIRKLPNKIDINIEERKTEAFLQLNNQLVDIDKQAIVLKILDNNQINKEYYPIIKGLDFTNISIGSMIKFKSVQAFNISLKIIKILKMYRYNNKITEINMSELNDIKLKDYAGRKIKLGSSENLKYKLQCLDAILGKIGNSEKGTIDFNYKKPIFIPGD